MPVRGESRLKVKGFRLATGYAGRPCALVTRQVLRANRDSPVSGYRTATLPNEAQAAQPRDCLPLLLYTLYRSRHLFRSGPLSFFPGGWLLPCMLHRLTDKTVPRWAPALSIWLHRDKMSMQYLCIYYRLWAYSKIV